MVVDYLRECHRSGRRLFAGRPDLVIYGRYFKAPPAAPVLRIPHCFGSTLWVRGEVEDVPIGEIPPTGYNFYHGDPPLPLPAPHQCGEASFFQYGDPGEPGSSPGPWGVAPCCYVVFPQEPIQLNQIDVFNPGVQMWGAALTLAAYEATNTKLLQVAQVLLGDPDSALFVPNIGTGPVPGYAILRYPNLTVVVVSGTTTPEQWAGQIVQGTAAPVDNGLYGTLPIWRSSAVTVLTDLVGGGVPADQPILVIGHSYGGVIATQIASIYRAANPTREIKLLTLGMPSPGDQRLADLTDRITAVHLANTFDPIPALPPNDFWSAVWIGFAGAIGLAHWGLYRRGGSLIQLNEDGTETPIEVTTAIMSQMLAILASVIVIAPFPPFPAHGAQAYYSRLFLNASAAPQWPLTAEKVGELTAIYSP